MITDSEDKSMIAELERIIRAEEAKPESERDEDLIDDCIREIADLKGVNADFSDEEVAEITDKLIKRTDLEKRKKRLVRIAAGIAAVFVLVGGVTACTINPAVINWFARIVRMPFGSSLVNNKITYYYQGLSKEYDSIEELLQSNSIEIYYPTILPTNTDIKYVEVFENEDCPIVYFNFTTDDLQFTVQLHFHEPCWKEEIVSTLEANGHQFNVYTKNNHYVSHAKIDDNVYIIQAKTIDDIILIVSGLRKD